MIVKGRPQNLSILPLCESTNIIVEKQEYYLKKMSFEKCFFLLKQVGKKHSLYIQYRGKGIILSQEKVYTEIKFPSWNFTNCCPKTISVMLQ